jgi:hypothetical protein
MIANKFGRIKWRQIKDREDFEQVEHKDEELEELRNWGYRLYEFRDHPIK